MDYSFISFFVSGILLGTGGGITPGPLNTLILSESIKHGVRGGISVAVAPLITDLPIVIGSIFLVQAFASIEWVIGVISLMGGVFVFMMGYSDLKSEYRLNDESVVYKSPMRKAILTNILQPAPYIFWITIGAPMIVKSAAINALLPYSFIFGFYLALVGLKIIFAILAGRIKQYIKEGILTKIMKWVGLLLILFSIILIVDGLKLIF